MRRLKWLFLFTVMGLAPASASAVTLDQVVALAHAGATDAVILALIERDKTIFTIEPEQLVTLQHDGVSEAVILAMLKSGRAEGEESARAVSAFNTATIVAAMAQQPDMVIVGHGPEVPNTAHANGFYSGPPPAGFYAPVYPYLAARPRSSSARHAQSVGIRPSSLCVARMTTGREATSPSLSVVSECPASMQPLLLR